MSDQEIDQEDANEQQAPNINGSGESDSDCGANSELVQAEEARRFEYIDQVICGELDEQVAKLNNNVNQSTSKDDIVAIRIRQLSLSKVMVNIHKKSSFLLVTAHSQLGEAYINTQCYEQALEHLTTALKYNGELLTTVTETKDYHIHLLAMLGRCYMEAGSPKEALGLLQKGYEMSKHVQADNYVSQASIIQLQAKCYLAQKDFEKSLELLMQAGDILSVDEENNDMLEQRSFVYIEIANLLKKKGLVTEAIDFKIRAFDFFSECEKHYQSDKLAELACTLSQWLEEANQIQEALTKLQNALEIYESKYGAEDHRACRVKRRVALIYLRCNQFMEALKELKEVEQIERVIYGDSSVSLAKTLKVIGTLLIISGDKEEAKRCLNEALIVFELRGNTKLIRETAMKLKQINKQGQMKVFTEEIQNNIIIPMEGGQQEANNEEQEDYEAM